MFVELVNRRQWLDEQHGPGSGAAVLAENAAEEAAAAAAMSVKRVGTMDDLQCLDEELEAERAGRYPPLTPTPVAAHTGCDGKRAVLVQHCCPSFQWKRMPQHLLHWHTSGDIEVGSLFWRWVRIISMDLPFESQPVSPERHCSRLLNLI